MTMKLGIAAVAVSVVFAGFAYGAEITIEDVSQAVSPRLTHPYLFFSASDLPEIRARIENDPAMDDIYRREIAEGNRLLYMPVDTKPPERVKQPRFEASYKWERYLTDNMARARTLAFCYQMTGDTRYAGKAFEFADAVCDLPTWTHSVHEFPVIYDRVWPWGADDDQVVFGYGQWTDHVVFDMATVYDWLYPALDLRQRDRIRGALLEKAVLRVRGNYEYHWWAAAYRCNWCAVCNASLGVAALALMTEDPNLADVVTESYNRISRTLDEIGTGGWQEGMGYLNYTLQTSMTFAETLKNVTGGDLDLFRHPRFADGIRTILYGWVPPDKSIHFGDSGGGKVGSYRLFNTMMLERGDRIAPFLRGHVSGGNPSGIFDIFRLRADLGESLPADASIHFPSVDWIIMRSDFTDPENPMLVAKSGMNNDPHHGHLDQGHVSLYWRGVEFLCDHGSAGYDKAYFDEKRWEYPLASTAGHNVVMVNDGEQAIAKRKNEPWQDGIGGTVLDFRNTPGRDYALLDPSGAYPDGDLLGWRRHIILDKPDLAVIVDEVAAPKNAEIRVRFHSAADQTLQDDYVLLAHDQGEMALVSVSMTPLELREGHHSVMMAQRNAKHRWVPYVDCLARSRENRTIIATVAVPLRDDMTASDIADGLQIRDNGNGGVDVTLMLDGEERFYRFNSSENGLEYVE